MSSVFLLNISLSKKSLDRIFNLVTKMLLMREVPFLSFFLSLPLSALSLTLSHVLSRSLSPSLLFCHGLSRARHVFYSCERALSLILVSFVFLSVYLSISLSVGMSVGLFVRPSVCLSVCPFVCSSVSFCHSLCLFLSLVLSPSLRERHRKSLPLSDRWKAREQRDREKVR